MERERLVESFRFQQDAAHKVGSAMYGELIGRCADDVASGGPVEALVRDWDGDPVLENLPLRLMGAVHREVIAGRAPALAAFYPTEGGRFDAEPAWLALRALVDARRDALRPELETQVQTNEVNRACALVAGAMSFARATGDRPIRLLEIGSSGGLNLVLDRHRYALGDLAFGPDEAALTLSCEWRGAPLEPTPLTVATRRGCDPFPIDLRDDAARIRLQSFVWPDQVERMTRLRGAISAALADPPIVDTARAKDWLPEQLATATPGVPTFLQQSVMWWYVPKEERREVVSTIEAAGERASDETPLGWMRMEGHDADHAELRLTLWPGGDERLLGRAHYHGSWVEWDGR